MKSAIDLARELIRLREAATQGEWKVKPGEFVAFLGQCFFEVVSEPLPGEEHGDMICSNRVKLENAELIAFAANHAKELAQALLDAEQKPKISVEAAVAGYHDIVLNQDKHIAELETELKTKKNTIDMLIDHTSSRATELEAQLLLTTNQASSLEAKLKDAEK